jgi:hypothetical protein
MKKALFLMALGGAIGYFAGFGDAQTHKENVVQRAVARVGKSTRDRSPNDVDAQMERLEKK